MTWCVGCGQAADLVGGQPLEEVDPPAFTPPDSPPVQVTFLHYLLLFSSLCLSFYFPPNCSASFSSLVSPSLSWSNFIDIFHSFASLFLIFQCLGIIFQPFSFFPKFHNPSRSSARMLPFAASRVFSVVKSSSTILFSRCDRILV